MLEKLMMENVIIKRIHKAMQLASWVELRLDALLFKLKCAFFSNIGLFYSSKLITKIATSNCV